MKMLKTILFVLVTVLALNLKAQEPTVSEKLTEVNDKVNGLLERVATDEADLQKLAKIKVSGYIQAQYQNFETPTLLAKSQNYFSLRRVRVKFTYEAADGIKFVLQPDFAPGNFVLKDAYAVVNDRWTKSWSLWAGKFNRPNYEVEYSSSQREILERSLVVRTLYPGERAIGAKLEYNPQSTPIHMQVAILNGADGITVNNAAGTNLNAADNIDYDNSKDVMARVTYNLPLGSFGGLDFGAHGYFGSLKSMTTLTYNSDYTSSTPSYVGEKIGKNWLGGEFQLFADVLGGLSVKGEYISGKNASIGYAPAGAVLGSANFVNNFAGSYLYVIKNLGKRNQLAFRYDYYDPNTDIKGADVTIKKYDATSAWVKKASSKSDLATTTYGIAFHHYLDDNVRITFNYDIVQNEKVGRTDGISNIRENYTQADGQVVTNGIDYGTIIPQNVFSIRIQAKF